MFVILLPSRMFCIGTLCTWLCACCATTTAWAPARTCWHWRPRIQSRRSAASGCISASARSVRQETADRICIDLSRWMLIAEPCRLTLSSFPSSPSKQEQAQSICKVLSASFDCALTSDKAWGRGRWATERLENQLKTEKYFQVAIISLFLPPQPAGEKVYRGDRGTVYPQNVKAWNKASVGGESEECFEVLERSVWLSKYNVNNSTMWDWYGSCYAAPLWGFTHQSTNMMMVYTVWFTPMLKSLRSNLCFQS